MRFSTSPSSARARANRASPEPAMLDSLTTYGQATFGGAWPTLWALTRIVAVVVPLLLLVAYLTLWERKAIGWSQIRPGPNRVGPLGLLQPIADAVKLIFKEIIVPTAANKGLFFLCL